MSDNLQPNLVQPNPNPNVVQPNIAQTAIVDTVNTLDMFGIQMQKKHVYIMATVVVCLLVYWLWKNKSNEQDNSNPNLLNHSNNAYLNNGPNMYPNAVDEERQHMQQYLCLY